MSMESIDSKCRRLVSSRLSLNLRLSDNNMTTPQFKRLILHPTSDDQKMANAEKLLVFLCPEVEADRRLLILVPTMNPQQLTLTRVGSEYLGYLLPSVHWPTYLAPTLPSQEKMEKLMEEKLKIIFANFGIPDDWFVPTATRMGNPAGHDAQLELAIMINHMGAENFAQPHSLSREEIEAHRIQMDRVILNIHELEYYDHIAMKILGYRDRRIADRILLNRIEHRMILACRFEINVLPDEILSNIFRYAIWGDGDPSRKANHRRAALWIGSTCRKWRSVALNDDTLSSDTI